jgi:hypothetical protein
MLQDRNRTVHTYNEATANEILEQVSQRYAALFRELAETFAQLTHDQKPQPGGP